MDTDVLAERILSDLSVTFKKDPLIDEFDILPMFEDVCNKCPVICVDHKVALEGWCVKHVYLYAYSQLIKWREHQHKIDPLNLLSWSRAVLLINPDVQTAWNIRKEQVANKTQEIDDELHFSELVLSRKAKCPDLFAHRKWLLQTLMKSQPSLSLLTKTIENEFLICKKAADRYPNNYYAWSHRIWVVQELSKNAIKIIQQELEFTHQWVNNHISDYSGFHYRQFLITLCANVQTDNTGCSAALYSVHNHISEAAKALPEDSRDSSLLTFLQKELLFTSELILTFPGHEALWYHRRFVIYAMCHPSFHKCHPLVPICTSHGDSEECNRIKKSKLEVHYNSALHNEEKQFLEDCLNKNRQLQQTLVTKHIQYLQSVLSWPTLLVQSLKRYSSNLEC